MNAKDPQTAAVVPLMTIVQLNYVIYIYVPCVNPMPTKPAIPAPSWRLRNESCGRHFPFTTPKGVWLIIDLKMSSSKEVKNLVKAARGALDREEYAEAIKQCEVSNSHICNVSSIVDSGCVLVGGRPLLVTCHCRESMSTAQEKTRGIDSL